MRHITVDPDEKVQSMRLAERFGYLGLIPFVALFLMVAVRPAPFSDEFISDMVNVGLLYSAIILSFMAGARWGLAIVQRRYDKLALPITAALVAWAIVLMGDQVIPAFATTQAVQLVAMAALFVILLVGELVGQDWSSTQAAGSSYRRLRISLTIVAVASLFLAGLLV